MRTARTRLRTWLAPALRRLAPGYSWCKRCGTPWKFIGEHATWYRPGYGVFALCQPCWSELTPKERLPFYRQVFDDWERVGCGDREWPEIERAVLTERAEVAA